MANESARERRDGDVLENRMKMTRVASRIYTFSAGTRPRRRPQGRGEDGTKRGARASGGGQRRVGSSYCLSVQ